MMMAIYLIPIMSYHRRGLYFYMVKQLYHGSHQTQTLISTSTNHSEIIVLYEASRECV
uniref:Uncharacterized protein n=1 Tax=Arundo donax TaxID=35708 RepID=A0A0A8ZG77_ARUDO